MSNWLTARISSILGDVEARTLLDVGCGLGAPTIDLDIPVKIGVDVYREYLYQLKGKMVPMNCDALRLGDLFLEDSFDIVTCLDVIEHLEKSDGLRLKKILERLCRKAIIFYTPAGFMEQKLKNGKDAWGYENEAQNHLSGFVAEDFDGYTVEMCKNGATFLAWKKN